MTISFWLYEEVKSLIMHIMEMELLCLLWGVWYGFIFNGTYFVDNDSDSNLTSPLKKSRTYWLNLIEICLHLSKYASIWAQPWTILSFVSSRLSVQFFCTLWQGLSPSLVPLFHLPIWFSSLLYFYWWYLSSTVGIDG